MESDGHRVKQSMSWQQMNHPHHLHLHQLRFVPILFTWPRSQGRQISSSDLRAALKSPLSFQREPGTIPLVLGPSLQRRGEIWRRSFLETLLSCPVEGRDFRNARRSELSYAQLCSAYLFGWTAFFLWSSLALRKICS